MPEITDPALLSQLGQSVTVSDGRKGTSSAEAKSIETGGSQEFMARDLLRGLAYVESMNRKVPTGRFNAAVMGTTQNLPPGWQSKDVPNYQIMNAASRSLLMPAAALQSGQALGASQINSEKELDYWQSTIPSPRDEPAAVTANVDRIGSIAQRKIAQENFNKVWRSKLGSLSAVNPRGKTAGQVFEDALVGGKMPALSKPLSRYLTEAETKRRGMIGSGGGKPAAPAVVDFNDL